MPLSSNPALLLNLAIPTDWRNQGNLHHAAQSAEMETVKALPATNWWT